MKAIATTRYGGPEVLALTELPAPKVGPDSVLVRAKAAGVNPVDWKIVAGYLDAVLRVHFPLVPGWDLAGVVEKVGVAVTEFAPGDEVIGYVREDHVRDGTYAELVAAPVRTLAKKPRSLDWPQAAALPLAGLTAWQAVEAVHLAAGETLLVHAASGGVGSLAVQIAKARGARVIGTTSPAKHSHVAALGGEPVAYGDGLADRVRALAPDGVDAVVDFAGKVVDVSIDLLRGKSRPVRLVSIVDGAVSAAGGRYLFVRPSTGDLSALARLADEGKLTVPVAETFTLARAPEALERNKSGAVAGKIAITIP
jgi:NADPH:quinone reductase-like Zn-dependent oxidoreductase